MASGYQAPVSAAQVGSYFATQYYKVLQQQPDYAHQFYTDSSTAIRVDGENSETSTALMEIHELITSLNFTNIELKTINSLESWNGGVLVVVSGSVKGRDFNGRRNFVQTFLLAPQDKGYFVLNDIFHFIDPETVPQHTVPVASEYNTEPQLPPSAPLAPPPVTGYSYEAEASEYVNSVHIDGDSPVDEYGLDEQEQEQEQEYEQELEEQKQHEVSHIDTSSWDEYPVEQPSGLHQNVVEAVPDPVYSAEEPVSEPQKFTYASILRTASKGQPAPVAAPRPTVTKPVLPPPPSEWQPALPAVQQSYSQEPSLEGAVENPSFEEEGELKSVYVRNLPSTVSAADLEQEFKNFGTIAHDGVFIRNRKDIGVCYAFVEFEDLVGVQNAIKASPIQLAGRQVYIEGRRANSGIASRGGRGRGRGRGSYPSEAPRGRFGGRSSGRGGYQDGGDFSGGKSRGNGFR